MIQTQPLVVIPGATGSGKTALALSLRHDFNIEIISADSRQVYRRMDTGTAKASAAEQALVPHHMIDLINPDEEFSVAAFTDRAHELIAEIIARGALPCVVGGTGLYIKALIGGLAHTPSADEQLREELHALEESAPGSLFRQLEEIDPDSAQQIHPNNLIRLVRAIEVFRLTGKPLSQFKQQHSFSSQRYNVLQIAPHWPREVLYQRIDQRAAEMFELGLVDEVRSLVDDYGYNLKALQTLGYREVVNFLQGFCTEAEMLSDIRKFTRHYAKRQLTWFRKEADIIWVDSSTESGRVKQSIDNLIQQQRRGHAQITF